jgi:hypothetical protein
MKTIKKNRIWLALALCCAAGCSNDSAHSLSRDYRNINNEFIDGLMIVTSESRAKVVNEKIVKVYNERVDKVSKRVQTYEQNTDEKLIVYEMLNSDSVVTLFAENASNPKRLAHETARIKRIVDTRTKSHVDRFRAEGAKDPDGVLILKASEEVRKEWPNLSGLTLAALKPMMEKGNPLETLFAKFPTKDYAKHRPPNFEQLNTAFIEKLKKLQLQ